MWYKAVGFNQKKASKPKVGNEHFLPSSPNTLSSQFGTQPYHTCFRASQMPGLCLWMERVHLALEQCFPSLTPFVWLIPFYHHLGKVTILVIKNGLAFCAAQLQPCSLSQDSLGVWSWAWCLCFLRL